MDKERLHMIKIRQRKRGGSAMRVGVCFALLLCVSTPVMADPALVGAYVSGGAGLNIAGTLNNTQGTSSIATNVGPVGVAAVGLKWAYGFRTELEGRYSANDFAAIYTRRVDGLLMPLTTSNGTASTSAIMGNLVYDIPLHPFGLPIQPYIGAGIGYARLGINATGGAPIVIQPPGLVAAPGFYFEAPGTVHLGSAGAFAYQAIAGFSVPLPLIPGLDLTLEYRYFGTAKEDIPITKATNSQAVQAFVPSPSFTQGFPLRDNEVLLGLRYTFATPPM